MELILEAKLRIEDYINDYAQDLAIKALQSDSISVYAYYSPATEDYGDDWEITTVAKDLDGYELIEWTEYVEAHQAVREILKDWEAYNQNPYAYNGMSRADFF